MALALVVPLFLISGSCGFVVPPVEEYQLGASFHQLAPLSLEDEARSIYGEPTKILLQSNPFDQLKKFTEWCNKTTTTGKTKNNKTDESDLKTPLNYTSFSMNLVREKFGRFEIEMNEELALVNKSYAGPNWELDAYKMFVALSFCPLADFYEVTTDELTPSGNISHLMVPTYDNPTNKTAFILNYGLSESAKSMREMAKKELSNMVANNLGADLREVVPDVRRLYRIFIAFYGPEGAVEHEGPSQLHPPEHHSTTERHHFLMNSPGDEEYQKGPEIIKQRDPMDLSAFAQFLTDKQFEMFEKKLNEELKFVDDNLPGGQRPVWDINNYKSYLMKAFCLLRNMYSVRGARKTGDGTCDHLIEPNPGNNGCAFTINYVISKSEKDLRDDAKKCLKKMLDLNFGKELSNRYPPLDDVYKICIAFKGPKAAVEYSKAAPQMLN